MATVTFKYPDTTSPTVTIEFEFAEFQGDVATPQVSQSVEYSDYNELKSRTYGSLALNDYPLTALVAKADQAGNTADVTSVDSFCTTTIKWATNPFYFTDSNGTAHKVKLVNTQPKGRELVNYIEYNFDLRGVAE